MLSSCMLTIVLLLLVEIEARSSQQASPETTTVTKLGATVDADNFGTPIGNLSIANDSDAGFKIKFTGKSISSRQSANDRLLRSDQHGRGVSLKPLEGCGESLRENVPNKMEDAEDEGLRNELDELAANDLEIHYEELTLGNNVSKRITKLAQKFPEGMKTIDLRRSGCIVEPQDQGECGCCYAYVISAAASYYNCMETRKLVSYSARFISDCGRYLEGADSNGRSSRPPIDGCKGGRIGRAIEFVRQAGLYPLDAYKPRSQIDDQCLLERPKESIKNWAPIGVDFFKKHDFIILRREEEVLKHLHEIGPVFINIKTWPNFALQGNKIYDGNSEYDEVDNDSHRHEKRRHRSSNPSPSSSSIHSMLIVGLEWDEASNRAYWILWNSLGSFWGEKGFVRVYKEALKRHTIMLAGFSLPALNRTN